MTKQNKAISGFSILIVYLAISFGFISNNDKNVVCSDLVIAITDSLNYRFIHHDDVIELINKKQLALLGEPINDINTKKLENYLIKQPYIKNAEVYSSINGNLGIEITQRDPLIRVFNQFNESYYIDTEGNILPTSNTYSAHLLVANGFIPDVFDKDVNSNIFDTPVSQQLLDIYELAGFISTDPLWSSQIVQLYVKENGEFDVIPRIGPHIIEFGPFDNYTGKFKKLKVLYIKGFNNIGWNNYLQINLKYKNQIICTRN